MNPPALPAVTFRVTISTDRGFVAHAHPWAVHADDIETLDALVAHADLDDAHAIVRARVDGGAWRLVEHRVHPEGDSAVSVAAWDVTDREYGRDREAVADAYWRAVLRNGHESIVVVEPSTLRITHATHQLGDLLGVDVAQLVGRWAPWYVDRRDLPVVRTLAAGWDHEGEGARRAEVRLRRADGTAGWIEAVVSDARADDAVGAFVVNIRDIGDRKLADDQLRASEHLFRVLVQHVADGAVVVDADGRMRFVSERAAVSLRASVDELTGRVLEIAAGPDGPLVRPARGLTGALPSLPVDARGPDGRWFHVTGHDLTDDPVVNATVLVLRDITDGRSRVERLRRQVQQDALTGLLNRRGLVDRLTGHLETGRAVAVGFLDLDGFKAVNDTHGHAAGDAVLRAVAARLRRCLRPGDDVARLGGDEFVVLLVDAPGEAELVELTERIVSVLVGTYTTEAGTVEIGVSAGWSVALPNVPAEEALRRADRRMYEHKRRSKA